LTLASREMQCAVNIGNFELESEGQNRAFHRFQFKPLSTGSRPVAEDLSSMYHVRGQVKWFDPSKGYGFVVSDEGGPDILLHVNVLRNFGQSSVADGAQVEIVTHRTDRGVQAVEVVSIAPPVRELSPVLADFADLDLEVISQAPMEPARVKWFDKGKGFGFANVFGSGDDVFLHVEVLRQSGLADLQPGEALAMRVIDGKRGRMAAEVMAWETAVPPTKTS
jgi:cold shock protein